jgi:hypothetical protein
VKNAAKFYAYARERYNIFLLREKGVPPPWTKDQILRAGRFCNVFREDDKTTRWFRQHVRERYMNKDEVLLATVVFRMFNRITTGEAIFNQMMLPSSRFKKNDMCAFDIFAATGDPEILRSAVLALMPSGPYCTGAYIISSPPGYTKLEGVLEVLARFCQNSGWQEWLHTAGGPRANECTLEAAHDWLREQEYFGNFHAYEIVTDLRHTPLLDQAPDIMTWASPGPGARRGVNRIWGLPHKDKTLARPQLIEKMRELLSLSRDARMWPSEWPAMELRDIEHLTCEWDKYSRVKLGQGKLKGKFDGG